eukprot:evm.model.scf_539.5 EVM.evm.TU.scf_539.5   scf_539:29696-31880(-)
MARPTAGGGGSNDGSTPGQPTPRSPSSKPHGVPMGPHYLRHSRCQRRVSNEDLIFALEGLTPERDGPPWSMYCVCDGHMGGAAAQYVEANLWAVLAPLLPKGCMPDGVGEDYGPFALALRIAVANAFVKLGEDFAKEFPSDASGELNVSNATAASRAWVLMSIKYSGVDIFAERRPVQL